MTGDPIPKGEDRKRLWEILMAVWDLAGGYDFEPEIIVPAHRRIHTTIYQYDLFGRPYNLRLIETYSVPRAKTKTHITVSRDGVWKITFRNFNIMSRSRWCDHSSNGIGIGKLEGKSRAWFTDQRRRADLNHLNQSNVFFEGDREIFDGDFALFKVSGAII